MEFATESVVKTVTLTLTKDEFSELAHMVQTTKHLGGESVLADAIVKLYRSLGIN